MNKFKLIIIFLFVIMGYSQAQNTVFGYVKDAQGKPIEEVEVSINSAMKTSKSDKVGYFQFKDIPEGNYEITFYKPNFYQITQKTTVTSDKKIDLGTVSLELNPLSNNDGVITLTDEEVDDDDSNAQSSLGLLSASRDAFGRVAAFELGGYFFRERGVDNRYVDVLFNGTPMSKQDNGRLDFSNWGGLNDVTRYPAEIAQNITPSEYTFGNLGGTTYYNTRASSFRKGTSLAYSYTNRSYFHRLMLTHSTGLMKSGWAITASGSRRWAEEGVIDGVYQDAYAYFLSVEKRLGKNHALNFVAFGSPTRRASNAPNTQEVYDLMGKNYNSYWGWQNGEKRNARVRNVFEPMFQLSHYWTIGKKSNLNTTVSYQLGSDARSRIDWLQTNDPNPTYYRKLPSYIIQDYSQGEDYSAVASLYTNLQNAWKTDQNVSQINWKSLYNANYNSIANFYSGKTGNVYGKAALYTVVEDVNEDKTLNVNSHFNTQIQDNWKLNINFNYQKLQSDNFRRIDDLLGADFALKLDGFGGLGKYDVDDASEIAYEGDRTQYSYDLFRDQYNLNISTEVDLAKWNFGLSIFTNYSESQRDGHYRHHFYLNDSKGKSDVWNNWDMGMKAEITYKLNGKNFLVYNGAYFSVTPTLNEIFINPRVNNFITPDLQNEIINSNQLSYIHRGQVLKIRATGYYTKIQNATEISRYFIEGLASGDVFIAEIINNANKVYKGAELGVEWKIIPTLTATGLVSYGDFKFDNNPDTYYAADDQNVAQGAISNGKANIDGYKVGGTPQKAYSFGLRYSSPKFWWVGASVNYIQDNYLDFSYLTRTSSFYTVPGTYDTRYAGATDEAVANLLKQQKFEDQFMVNASIGKSFIFGKYRMGISINVNNVLNNKDYVTGGFEQGRRANFPEATEEANRYTPLFGPKLWYDRGISFFGNVYLRF